MKTSIILLLAFLALLINPALLSAQDIGSSGATFLKLGAGARPIGMGSAFSGLSDDVNAIYWNPAGLGFIKRWELSFTYQKLFADFDYQALFYSHQLRLLGSRKAALGFGLLRLGSLEEWDSTDGKMPAIAASDVSDFAVILPFAYRFDWLSRNLAMGMNYKYVNSRLGDYTSNAHGIDWGLMFKTSLFDRLFWSIGTTIQNVTLKKVQFIHDAELLPLTLRGGSALKIFLTENQDLTLAYDVSQPRDNHLKHHFGLEYWLHLGIHRFGLRGGYRLIDQDLGKFAFSIGYGLDVTPMARNSYFSEMDLGLNNYNPDILGNTELFSITLKPNRPEPFRRLLPEYDAQFTSESNYWLTWEESFDYDDHDRVEYLVVLDTSYAKIDSVKNNARKIIGELKHHAPWNAVIFHQMTSATSARFYYQRDADFQTFYWAVIAFDRNLNITIATGSDEIGKFSNRNLPDIKPVALKFAAASQFDTSKFQGELESKFIGLIKKPCRVVIYDSTDAKIICSGMIPQLAAADTFRLIGKWWADKLGQHRIAAIADFEQSIAERNEANNVLCLPFLTIPYGIVSVPDTIKLEELSYEHIELPTIPYIFFEPNSTDFSRNSRMGNETDPDSLLKLFGNRLQRDYPGLKIWLRGYVDPVSEQPVAGDGRLSYLRAEKVKQKLIEYGASQSQVIVLQDHRDTDPRLERTSSVIDPLDQAMVSEENRRVEIRLPDNLPATKKVEYEKRFFAPHRIARSRNEILSEKIPIRCRLHTAAPLKQFTIFIKDYAQDPFPIKIIQVDTLPVNELRDFTLLWDGIKDNNQMIAFNKSYHLDVQIVAANGKNYLAPGRQFFVGRDIIVKEKRIFALAKFNKVDPLHQFYIEQLDQVEDNMKRDGRLRIRFYGHTDVIGTEERNNILSAERALELSSWLAKIIDIDYRLTDSLKAKIKSRIDNPISPTDPNIASKFKFGKGETAPLIAKNIEYGNNQAPQGRTLNRRVDIEIYRMDITQKPALFVEKNITFHPWLHVVVPPKIADVHQAAAPTSGWPYPLLASNDPQTIPTGQHPVTAQAQAPDSATATRQSATTPAVEIIPELINCVTCIETTDSILWIGTENGLLKWNARTDSFKLIGLDLWKYRQITALQYDPVENCLWVGTHKGLRRLSQDEWGQDVNVGSGLSGNVINSLLRDQQGQLLVGTNEGINIRGKDGWQVLANLNNGLKDDFVNYIYQGPDQSLWCCTNQGVYRQVGGSTWLPFTGNEQLLSDTVYCMLIDAAGNKWFGTAEGLCRFNANDEPAQVLTFDPDDPLTVGRITALQQDSDGNIWCATHRGLAICRDGTWYGYHYEDGLPANRVTALRLQPQSQNYVGFHSGGLSLLHLME